MKPMLLVIALGVTFFLSCKKDKTEPPPPSSADILIDGGWTIRFYGIDENEDGVFDFEDIYENGAPACWLDDTYTFFKDGSYEIAPGENTNGCTDQVITGGTWEISEDGKKAVINELSCTIDSLSQHYLRYHYDETEDGVVSIYTR